MNPSPQQLAVGAAVAVFAAAAAITPTDPVIGNELVIIGCIFGTIATVLSTGPIRQSDAEEIIRISATIAATGAYGGAAYGSMPYGG